MNRKSGFTLIELLVVIAIIGVLAGVLMVALTTSRQRGADAAKIGSVREVRTAINQYFNDNGVYPVGQFATGVTNLTTALVPKYISSIDANIKYQSMNSDQTACASNCASYHLGIPLTRTDNSVLKVDGDIVSGNFDGTKDNCTAGSVTASIPDLCYDLIP